VASRSRSCGRASTIGADVTVTNESYNSTIPAGGGIVDFGFLAAWSGTNNVPIGFSLNGIPCTVD
jgi:hypothetical protein